MKRFDTIVVIFLVSLALGALLNACGLPADTSMNKVTYIAKEYQFDGPDSIPAGFTQVTLQDRGTEMHHIQLIKLDNGKTVNDLLGALKANPETVPAWAQLVAGPNSPVPGGDSTAIVNFQEGNYVVVCLIPDQAGVAHIAHGMFKPLSVTAPGIQKAEPAADTTIELADFNFNAPAGMKAGAHTFKVVNKGTQAHEAFLVQLAPGASVMDFLGSMESERPLGKPLGGLSGMNPGSQSLFSADLTSGKYALICFFPDQNSHKAHVELGMMKEFTVN